jgi:hypothetical protein
MLGPVRGASAPPHGVRFLLLLISWVSIAGGPLAPARAGAAPSDWLPVVMLQAGGDSLGSSQVPRYTPSTRAPAGPKFKANSFHLQGGLFAPIDVNAPSPTLGLRAARRFGGHSQAGLLVDWTFERKNLEQPVNSLPGLQPHLILARADGQLIPAMAFFQVNLTDKRYLIPYAGIAMGYEWLLLRANDFRTGELAKATYANWAWQSWGGIGLRLDQGLRVDFELSYNGGSLERDVTDSNGQTFSEAVRVNGVGARVGVDILY